MKIRDLVLEHKGDRTYSRLEADTSGVVKAQRWNQITNGHRVNEFPEPKTIEAMAVALDLPCQTVLMAFAESLGLPVNVKSSFASVLPPSADNMTPKQQAAVLAVIRSYNYQP